MCFDIVADPLPEGELCLIRHVLQYLSNSQIASVLQKTRKYRYVLVTEYYPAPFVTCRPDLAKSHGPDTRIYDDSAVYLDQPASNVRPKSITLVLGAVAETYLVNKGERLSSTLYKTPRCLIRLAMRLCSLYRTTNGLFELRSQTPTCRKASW